MESETKLSVLERCAAIEREMTALTKELRQKTDALKAFYDKYDKRIAKLNSQWHELFDAISDDDETRESYWDLTRDIEREI